MSLAPHTAIRRLVRFGLTTRCADRLATFYENVFGFRRMTTDHVCGPDFETLMGVDGGARRVMLGLGHDVIELLEFDTPGALYPAGAGSSDLIFQHFAIVTTNMNRAFDRLSCNGDWKPISSDSPQQLPESSGGVTAFKFRDPDGHPLELLAFPGSNLPSRWRAHPNADLCLGIDHSAICVSDSERSIAFYEGFGLRISARSVNQGPEQARLDGVRDPCVEVTALSPIQQSPHVELLCYQPGTSKPRIVAGNNDVAATRLVFEVDAPPSGQPGAILPQEIVDPDGHRLVMLPLVAGARARDRLRSRLTPASASPVTGANQ